MGLRGLVLLLMLMLSAPSRAYSVLTHEQIVDLLWKAQIRPLLLARFPDATEDEIRRAHAYAYGGSLIQDIGYYPFGNHFFSDLVHYVRSGDFVGSLLQESKDIDEYAFALGALAHYASDVAGHPVVNRAVAETFPKLQLRFGASVTYADDPKAHIRTEFGFDVVQVAKGRFTSEAFHDFIGFEVSRPLLERSFLATYGLPLESVFPDLDLAIGSFRYSVSRLIPRMTKVALAMKGNEIVQEDPTMTRRRFLYRLKKSEFRRDWGSKFQQPSVADRILAFFLNLLPKVGPLRTLDFKMPTPATEDQYLKSVLSSVSQYGLELTQVASGGLHLDNKDFDTGQQTRAGEYSLTDSAYANLLGRLADRHFESLPTELRGNLLAFYRERQRPAFAAKDPARWNQTLQSLHQLEQYPASTEGGR